MTRRRRNVHVTCMPVSFHGCRVWEVLYVTLQLYRTATWPVKIRSLNGGCHQRIDIICSTFYTGEVTYVITQPCIGVKDASCVDVCPVDCIHPSQNEEGFDTAEQLYINPDECIDCGACEPACPVTAIFEESATPEEWKDFIKINADFFKV